jgi:magnesium transporter
MKIVEFSGNTLRFLDSVPQQLPRTGFIWIYLERDALEPQLPTLQHAAHTLGGSPLLDLHVKDLANRSHPSRYDYTSIYDLVIFRRLATEAEVRAEVGEPLAAKATLGGFARIRTRAVGFVVFDRLLISVHPSECYLARAFIERYLADAVHSEGLNAAARSRLPSGAADLMLRMLNVMVDNYLDLRKVLSAEIDAWQQQLLLASGGRAADWAALMTARNALHMLQDLCDEQHDAMQEWLDTQREQPVAGMSQAEQDGLLARARDVVDHIERVMHHLRRMEQSAETAVQIHFSAQGNRTNEIMQTLTAITAVFLPLNLITGIFGMNFEFLPLIHHDTGLWWVLGLMAIIVLVLGGVFWRKRVLSRNLLR